MRLVRAFAGAALAVGAASAAVSAHAAEMKIGFVNTERVFREAAPAKRAQQALEREFSARNAELGRIEKQGATCRPSSRRKTSRCPRRSAARRSASSPTSAATSSASSARSART
jgi:Skp family chaperone for outer membrane proteins